MVVVSFCLPLQNLKSVAKKVKNNEIGTYIRANNKRVGKVVPVQVISVYGGMEDYLHVFLFSALDKR